MSFLTVQHMCFGYRPNNQHSLTLFKSEKEYTEPTIIAAKPLVPAEIQNLPLHQY